MLLESLEHKDVGIRFTNARRLLYVLQGTSAYACTDRSYNIIDSLTSAGTFGETTSQEHQLHWIFENAKLVRAANGVSNIVEAFKIASAKHDFLRYSRSSPTRIGSLY